MENNEHLEKCPGCGAALKYAYMKLTEDFTALIDAEEMCFFDALLEKAKENIDIEIDETSEENASYKLVYGGMLVNETTTPIEEAVVIAHDMVGFTFAHITEDMAITCKYKEIMFFTNNKPNQMGIPFVAIMKLPEELNDRNRSVTLTPMFSNHENMWEHMVNRPFLLACRLEEDITGRENECLESLINTDTLNEAFARAFIVEGVEEE